eukprot:SAG11_NODE_24073_length_378_cov_1.286738_1_plen_64_part_01
MNPVALVRVAWQGATGRFPPQNRLSSSQTVLKLCGCADSAQAEAKYGELTHLLPICINHFHRVV